MLFGKILFGKALLFGYAVPVMNVAVASVVFGLVIFSVTLAIIFVAKFADKKPIFKDITSAIAARPSVKTMLPAIVAAISFLIFSAYAAPLQLALFGKVLLGGTILTNFGFALIPTAVVGLIMGIAMNNDKGFAKISGLITDRPKQISAIITLFVGTWFANSILKTLLGITLTVSPGAVAFASLAVGLLSAFSIYFLIRVAEIAIKRDYGFALTMYAVSFLLLSIYASPIQIAILGHAMMLVTPLLSNISFGAIVGVVTSFITTKLYRATETTIAPALISPYATATNIKAGIKDLRTSMANILSEVISELNGSDSPAGPGK
jgi:hypothetical protein